MNDDSYVVDLFGVLSCVKPSGLDSWLYLLSTCTCSWKLFYKLIAKDGAS